MTSSRQFYSVPVDTTLEAARFQFSVWRRMTGAQRIRLVGEMNETARSLLEADVRSRHPRYNDSQIRSAVARIVFGENLPVRSTSQKFMTQIDFLQRIVARLEDVEIPYMVSGSYGSTHYSGPRTTQDVDIVIDADERQVERFAALLTSNEYISLDAARDAVRNRRMFNVIDAGGGWKADLIVLKDRPFSIEEFNRRRDVEFHGKTIQIVSPEDSILSKLEWARDSNSERQLQDAEAVAVVQWNALDCEYLRKWAAELSVSDELERILANARDLQEPARDDE